MTKPFWVSWEGRGAFTYHGPWWESGWRESEDSGDDVPIFCAAVMAEDHDAARQVVIASHDGKSVESWRFVTEKPAGWAPFCERFARRDWMRWPWPENAGDDAP